MVITAKSKILKNPDANTQYITIPASMTLDSQYPFKPNELVDLEVDGENRILIVRHSLKKK